MDQVFFNGWQPLLRIVIVGVCSYVALIVMLRIAGKRTLSRMNAYDMVITMALGSILAKVLLTPEQSIAESMTAMFVLIALQFIVSVAMCRLHWLRRILSEKPAVLFHRGEYILSVMRRERVDKEEIEAAVNAKGIPHMELVEAVILAANGDLSVVLKSPVIHALTATAGSRISGDP